MTSPAVEVRAFAATIPAGTLQSAPFTVDVFMPARQLLAVHWKVPPGPSGLMGWRLTMSGGNPVIPTGGGWIVTDNDAQTWAVTDQPDSGAWEITGYNTDIYPHTIYVDFLLDLVGQAEGPPPLIPNTAISSPTPATVTTVSVPPPVSIPPVSIPAITTPPPVSIPPIPPPPPVTVVQPVFTTTPPPPPARTVVVPVTYGERATAALAKIEAAGLTASTNPARNQAKTYISVGSVPEGGRVVPAGSHVIVNVRVT